MIGIQRNAYFLISVVGMFGAIGCGKGLASSAKPSASATGSAVPTSASAAPAGGRHAKPGPEPESLLIQTTSAYSARVFADTDAAYLMTAGAAYRLVSDTNPLEVPIKNGSEATVTPTSLIYWSNGALFRKPKRGGKAERLLPVPNDAQNLTSRDEQLVWNEVPSKGKYVIGLLGADAKVHRLHGGDGDIWSLLLAPNRVFFLEIQAGKWRIGSVDWKGEGLQYASHGEGRGPCCLIGHEQIYYYEVNTKELRRLSFDLAKEEVLTRGLDCSQLAVGDQVYCANGSGIYEIPKHANAQPVQILDGANATSISVSSTMLVWVTDYASGKLSVDTFPLTN